jgi:hypothetical protein
MFRAFAGTEVGTTNEVSMTFRKGKSPNPNGRKIEAQVKRAARAEGPGCVATLAALRDNERATPEVRAQAAMRLLDIAKWKWNGPAALPAKGGL